MGELSFLSSKDADLVYSEDMVRVSREEMVDGILFFSIQHKFDECGVRTPYLWVVAGGTRGLVLDSEKRKGTRERVLVDLFIRMLTKGNLGLQAMGCDEFLPPYVYPTLKGYVNMFGTNGLLILYSISSGTDYSKYALTWKVPQEAVRQVLTPFAAEADKWSSFVSHDTHPRIAPEGASDPDQYDYALFTVGDLKKCREVVSG